MTARRRLRGHASLTEAVDFYLAYNNPHGETWIMSELLTQYLVS